MLSVSVPPVSQISLSQILIARGVIGNCLSVIPPYILHVHDSHGCATTKREDFVTIVIVQKQLKNHVCLTGANQRFIWRIEEHRFGVEPEIVTKLGSTAVSHQQQRDVARRATGLPAYEDRAQLFRHARAAVPALVRLMLALVRGAASAPCAD